MYFNNKTTVLIFFVKIEKTEKEFGIEKQFLSRYIQTNNKHTKKN